MLLPPPLLPGQPLAIVAPASTPREPERLTRGLSALESDGFQPLWSPEELTPAGYLAGTDEQRTRTVNQALLAHPHIMCVRGGYGCLRLLDALDYAAIGKTTGMVVGFSDITALQLALLHHCGWRALSGPVVVEWGEIDDAMKQECLRLLRGDIPEPITGLTSVQQGTHTGTLIGGNLATIVRLVGTSYIPDMNQAILFVEDVNEPPYRIDALFAQLHLAGILSRIGGLVVGSFTGQFDQDAYMPIIQDYSRLYDWPVASGLLYGHFHPRRVMPIGIQARLNAGSDTAHLEMLEPVTGRPSQ